MQETKVRPIVGGVGGGAGRGEEREKKAIRLGNSIKIAGLAHDERLIMFGWVGVSAGLFAGTNRTIQCGYSERSGCLCVFGEFPFALAQ